MSNPIAFTTSVRTPRGRLFIDVAVDALVALGADRTEPASLLATFSRHAPLIEGIATSRVEGQGAVEVTIGTADVARASSA